MKHKSFNKISLSTLATILFTGSILTSSAQTRLYKHSVQSGETIYQLSVKYGVSVDAILACNPTLKDDGLKTNTVILIPVVQHKDGIKGTNCRLMHKVKKKETLWGIAKQYGLTVEELLKANPDISSQDQGVKKGMFLCIPYASSEIMTVLQPQIKGYDKLNIAIVLPLLNKSTEGQRCVEFYRGFLMAVDEIKKKHVDVQISAFDEPQSSQEMSEISDKIKKLAPQMVVGPLFPSHFKDLSNLTKQDTAIKWLLPFSSKYDGLQTTPNVFMLNAPIEIKAQIAAGLFSKTFKKAKAVFLHETNGNELTFSVSFRNALIKKGSNVIDLPAGYSTSQMEAAIKGNDQVVFIPETSDEEEVKKVIEKLKQLRRKNTDGAFALFAYPSWLELAGISRNDLFFIDTYIYNNHFYNPYSAETQKKAEDYSKWFKMQPLPITPRMFLLGYDSGLKLMTGLNKYGKSYNTQKIEMTGLQENIEFMQESKGSGYINNSMYFIHYRKNGVIDLISDVNYK